MPSRYLLRILYPPTPRFLSIVFDAYMDQLLLPTSASSLMSLNHHQVNHYHRYAATHITRLWLCLKPPEE
jgi:hypothetical protein